MHFRPDIGLLATLAACHCNSALAQSATQIFNFSTYIAIENSALRPNGKLLLTTLANANLYSIDPSAANPEAEVVATLPGATALTGIAAIGHDTWAVTGGVRGSYSYTNETIYMVTSPSKKKHATVQIAATLPNAVMLNGLAALPSNPHVLLAADSRVGCLWRIDLDTGAVAKAVEAEEMTAPTNATAPIGVDGLKISGGYAYFSNVARLLFARVPIIADGSAPAGDVEVLTYFADDEDFDDFAITADGRHAFGAQTPSFVGMVDLKTGESSVAVNETGMTGGPTSIVLKGDGSGAYVTTRGSSKTGTSGQVFEVTLPVM